MVVLSLEYATSLGHTTGPVAAMVFFVGKLFVGMGHTRSDTKQGLPYRKAYLGYNTQSAESGQLRIWISFRDSHRFVVKASLSLCIRKHLLIGICLRLSLGEPDKGLSGLTVVAYKVEEVPFRWCFDFWCPTDQI